MGNVRTMDQVVAQTLVGDRFTTALFAGFAAVAPILAALGIYGVMSFAVAQRTHEIGLRIALGVGRGRVLWQVLREAADGARRHDPRIGWRLVRGARAPRHRLRRQRLRAGGVRRGDARAARRRAGRLPRAGGAPQSVDPMVALRQD